MMLRHSATAVLLLASACAPWEPQVGQERGWHHMMDYWYGGGWTMGLIWIVVIALVIYLVFRAVGPPAGSAPPEPPLEILRKRYARGEISREEFERMKDEISG